MPTADVQSRLQAVLGQSYALDRELGGGGMARVFVARDLGLGRHVVVKLLPPELAGEVSVERFRREIALAARLQHPHVVPLLTAGEADGLLFYTMPYVEGESLRDRLARAGRLPIAECVALLREVADAVAHAHARGVVHRDLKPANVLLSGGHALVADFGIAKALATSGQPGALTSIGVAIGTPAYMAPEQALGDPAADHRVDLYSLGVVAYEMLAGAAPFAATSHQELVAAHLTQVPPPLDEQRPDVPRALAALVVRLLAKRAAERPASADEVLQTLRHIGAEAVEHPSAVAAPAKPRRRARRGSAAALAVGLLAVAAWPRLDGGHWRVSAATPTARSGAVDGARRVVVVPFANATGDSRLDALGLLAADVVTQRLVETGLVDVASPPSPLASGAADGAPGGVRAASDPIAVGRELGARWALSGRIYRVGDDLRVQPVLADVARGELAQAIAAVHGPAAAPDSVLSALRERVLAALAVVTDDRLRTWARAAGAPPTYEAYRALVDGRAAWPNYRVALEHFERAVRIDSTYALALIEVATASRMLGRCETTDSIARRLHASSRPLAAFDRAFLDGQLAACRGDPEGMYRAGQEQVRLAPQSVAAAYSLYHGALARNRLIEAATILEPFPYARGASEIGPTIFSSWGVTLHVLGRDARGLEVVRAGQRYFPTEQRLWFGEQLARIGLGRTAEVTGELRRAVAAEPPAADFAFALLPLALDLRTHGGEAESAETMQLLDSALAARPAAERASTDHRAATAFLAYARERWPRAGELFRSLVDAPVWAESAHGHLGALAARRGDRAGAERELAWLARIPPGRSVGPLIWRVRIHALLGERARATELMTEAMRFNPHIRITALVHGRADLDSLRGDPAFEAVVRPRG